MALIDVDVHEMFRSIKDLLPHLDEPWRSRVEPPANPSDGWKLPALPYSWPQVGGVARADAAPGDGGPSGSDYEMTKQQLLDRYNVESAILTGLFHPTDIKVQPEFASALARAYNDWLSKDWLDKDERFKGSICVAAQQPDVAAAEIDRLGPDPRFVQVMLPACSHDVLGRSYYHPIFEAAERNQLVVGFHQSLGTQTAVGLPPYYFEWHTTIFQAWQSQLTGLIAHGVFDKFPDLRVALIESGWTWLPSFMWRLDENYRGLRREVPWVQRMPSDIIRTNVRIATHPMEMPSNPKFLSQMFEMIESDEMLMFSTDYPHWDGDSPEHVLSDGNFPKATQKKILYDNAKSFYRL